MFGSDLSFRMMLRVGGGDRVPRNENRSPFCRVSDSGSRRPFLSPSGSCGSILRPFGGGVAEAMPKIGQQVGQASLQGFGRADHRAPAGVSRPEAPASNGVRRPLRIRIGPKGAHADKSDRDSCPSAAIGAPRHGHPAEPADRTPDSSTLLRPSPPSKPPPGRRPDPIALPGPPRGTQPPQGLIPLGILHLGLLSPRMSQDTTEALCLRLTKRSPAPQDAPQPVKRRRALLASNPRRNNRFGNSSSR